MKKIIALFIESLKFVESPATRITYEQGIKTYARAVGVNAPMNLETYIKFLKALSLYSPSTQHVYRSAVISLYGFYCDEHGGNVNLLAMKRADKRYLKKHVKGEGVDFDRESVNKLVEYALTMKLSSNPIDKLRDLRDRAFIILLVDTGLRISEACNLKRGDIPWESKTIFIIGKGKKKAKIRFSDRSLTAVKRYLDERAKLDGTTGIELASLPVFARHDRGAGKKVLHVDSGGMWASFKSHLEKAGVSYESISPHIMRHEAITRYYEGSRDIKETMEFSRHSRMDTVNRYTHLIDTDVDNSYDEIFNEK